MRTTIDALMAEGRLIGHEMDGGTFAADVAHLLGLRLGDAGTLVEAAMRVAVDEESSELSMFQSGLTFGVAAERMRQREARDEPA